MLIISTLFQKALNMTGDNMNDLDIQEFRKTLAQFPTGVTVITTRDAERNPIGVTASSFNSVSVDPPLILWSIDKKAYSKEIFEKSEYFGVNVLTHNQIDISNRFSRKGDDKFKDIDYHNGKGDTPMLNEYSAQFECKTWNVYEGGDHLILVGEVVKYRHNETKPPLVFAHGNYAIVGKHPEMMAENS